MPHGYLGEGGGDTRILEWHLSMQVSQPSPTPEEAICGATERFGGAVGYSLAYLEGSDPAKEWQTCSGSFGALFDSSTFDACLGLTGEDDSGHEQDNQRVLWCGKAQANGGHCSVAWEEVCTPRWAGGLSIPSLRWLNVAMQARWA